MDIYDLAETVKTKEDFVVFIKALVDDLQHNEDSWENPQLDRFLEAFGAWVKDMDGYYMNMQLPPPQNINWSVIVDMLMAARVYE